MDLPFDASRIQTIGVLTPEVARKLLAGPLFFRDRAITRFPDADQLVLERGARKATFQRVEGNWKLTQPISADADQKLIDDTIDMLSKEFDAKSVGFAADGTLMLPDLHGDEDLLKAVRALVANEPELSSLVVKNWLAEDE